MVVHTSENNENNSKSERKQSSCDKTHLLLNAETVSISKAKTTVEKC